MSSGSDGQGHFEIDSQTGDLRTTELFNQDTQLYYTVRVAARDGGSPPLEEEAVLYVQVPTHTLTLSHFTVFHLHWSDTTMQ